MLVLVSFVLVLAAAVTLVVGLLQSGLTLIYLSIGCSVLAGVVLAVAVLRGRPESRPATSGRPFTPPAQPPVPATVGAPSATETSSWTTPAARPTPPPPAPVAEPAAAGGQDLATRAAGSALLGRLRGRKGDATPEPVASVPVVSQPDLTAEIPAVSAGEGDDGFPVADYDRLRATELLALLGALDRNQLEDVRQREASGKNRFTIMSRIDSLLASKEAPAWQAADASWDDDAGTDAESEAVIIEAEALRVEDDFDAGVDDDSEVDDLVSPTGPGDFLIAGYDTLTVGQILPRLSDLSAAGLAQVRTRERAGRNRGTILDRIDRLSARAGSAGSGALAMPAATGPARGTAGRKAAAPAKKAPTTTTRARPSAPPAPSKAATSKAATSKAATSKAATSKAATSKAATSKAATRKAPIGKAPAAKAPAVPAKKAPAKAPAKKAPAKAATAKKAPAKRATRRS